MDPVLVLTLATRENYYEVGYLAANPDVAQAVAGGSLISGKQHFEEFGEREGRMQWAIDATPSRVARTKSASEPLSIVTPDDIKDHNRISEICTGKYIYFGNLLPHEDQYKSGKFVGLALVKRYDRDIIHDATETLPFPDNFVIGFQSQDVFEHIDFKKIPHILNEIYRCLRPSGLFRLSVPDYNSPLLKRRSIYDADGFILCDLAMGASVNVNEGTVTANFSHGGDAHLWFPTYQSVLDLIVSSDIRKCSSITFHHAWTDPRNYRCEEFDQAIMPVARTPPRDMRADGKPISIVVDFLK